MRRLVVTPLIPACLVAFCFILCAPVSAQRTSPLIIDHTSVTLFDQIPTNYLGTPDQPDQPGLAGSLTYFQKHMSVGQGIDNGLSCLQGTHLRANTFCPGVPDYLYNRTRWAYPFYDGEGYIAENKMAEFEQYVHNQHQNYQVMAMKFCYLDALGNNHPDWDRYRTLHNSLATSYPNTTIVWWTIPVRPLGEPGTDVFNELVRAYAQTNNKVLFDLAAIESNGGACHNGSLETLCPEFQADALGHLSWAGNVHIAKGVWVLMAQLAGWDPSGTITPPPASPTSQTAGPGDYDGDGDRDFADLVRLLPLFGTSSSFNLLGSNLIDIFDFNYLVSRI